MEMPIEPSSIPTANVLRRPWFRFDIAASLPKMDLEKRLPMFRFDRISIYRENSETVFGAMRIGLVGSFGGRKYASHPHGMPFAAQHHTL